MFKIAQNSKAYFQLQISGPAQLTSNDDIFSPLFKAQGVQRLRKDSAEPFDSSQCEKGELCSALPWHSEANSH